MSNMIPNGTTVSYMYFRHPILGGGKVEGTGVVLDWTIVGTDRAYVIKPLDGSDVVHVKTMGVIAA